MRLDKILLPATALGAAALFFATDTTHGFNTLGGQLDITQRDVRVFNNFSKPAANNNIIPDASWPGYDGAEMSIWKACTEWSSELHGGFGFGDPLQTVGSGGANFDITWQGNSFQVGGSNDNTHSEIAGSAGGVLAFCETPISNGWRIRYYETWNWQDGPGAVGGGIDLQGVATHEYGHALGLDHTNVGGATMFPSISGNGQGQRSIENDDIAGVQFIYGVKSAFKPRITGVVKNGTQLTINGTNFSATNNEVWFTDAELVTDGEPIKVTGLNSNGTQIVVITPAGVGPGDLLVRSNGTANSNLSNAWPVDPDPSPPCGVVTYCTGKVSSAGIAGQFGHSGTPSLATQDLILTSFTGVGGTVGIYLFSDVGEASIPFANGFLCVAAPFERGPGHVYDGFGVAIAPITVVPDDVGKTRWFTFWYRDVNHPDGTAMGTTNAGAVTFCN